MKNTVNLSQFEKYLEKRVQPSTVQVYMLGVRKFLESVNGGGATPSIAQNYIDHLSARGLAASTVSTRAHAIMRWFRWEGKEIHLDCPTIRMKEPEYLSMSDVNKAMLACHTQLEKTIVVVLFDTAVRINELLTLKISDIDRQQKLIVVTRKGGLRESVNISDKALVELDTWLNSRPSKDDSVFLGMSYYDAWSMIKRIGKRAGIKTHPHIFRHSRAIQMLLNGASLHDVQIHLGHRNISTTTNIYGRFKAIDVRYRIPEW